MAVLLNYIPLKQMLQIESIMNLKKKLPLVVGLDFVGSCITNLACSGLKPNQRDNFHYHSARTPKLLFYLQPNK